MYVMLSSDRARRFGFETAINIEPWLVHNTLYVIILTAGNTKLNHTVTFRYYLMISTDILTHPFTLHPSSSPSVRGGAWFSCVWVQAMSEISVYLPTLQLKFNRAQNITYRSQFTVKIQNHFAVENAKLTSK